MKTTQLCQCCRKRAATRLCDAPVGILVNTLHSTQDEEVKEDTFTCKRLICNQCTTQIAPSIDYCPDCMARIKALPRGTKGNCSKEPDMDKEDEFDFLINFTKNAEDLSSHIEASQLRCLWTAFCLHHDISVGSLVYEAMYRSLVEAVKRNISANYEDEEYRILHDRMSMYVWK